MMEEVFASSEKREHSGFAWHFTLSPKWLPLRLWEAFVAVTTVVSTTLVAFQASFDAESVWLKVLVMVLDSVYIVAMVLQFFTGYTRKGLVVTNHRKIALRYLKTTLIPDLLSVIPVELLAIAASSNTLYSAVSRLNRLLRCYRLILFCCECPHPATCLGTDSVFSYLFLAEQEQQVNNHTNLYRGVRYSYLAWLSFHLQACMWFALACDNTAVSTPHCKANSWANTPSVISIGKI